MKYLSLALLLVASSFACSNLIVTKGANAEGNTIVTYSADSHVLFGCLYHYPAKDHAAGEMRDIYDWDGGFYRGKIPEVAHTYNVVGNVNEFGVAIGETTYGGVEILQTQTGAIMDYGSLIWVALQRSRNAREAILTMADLVAKYGYGSEGESFSVGDPNEAWIFEMIGKGEGEKGAVWVAVKIPDGSICGHANQARIQKFAWNDTENCLHSDDVVSFAQKKGLYPQEGKVEDFSFSDIYNPISFMGARGCDGRVWTFFRRYSTGMDDYLDYVKGDNLNHRMPLYVTPTRKITLNETMNAMRDHFEDTWLAFDQDVGAQGFGFPYRWRPLTYKVDDKTYTHERSIATQQTGWSFVAQLRQKAYSPISSILWFGVDDTALTVWTPIYCGTTRVPYSWAKGNGDMMTFSFRSAFWVFNLVSNFVYTRWSVIYPEVFNHIQQLENRYMSEIEKVDAQASARYPGDPAAAVEIVTSYSERTANSLVDHWLNFFQYLFTKYMDGNVKFPNPKGEQNPIVQQPGYPPQWYRRIVNETGDHYLVKETNANAKDPNVPRDI